MAQEKKNVHLYISSWLQKLQTNDQYKDQRHVSLPMAVPENAAESGNATKKEIFIVQIKENSEGHFVKKAEVRLLAFC